MNRLCGVLENFEEQKGILRLFVRLEAQRQIQVLLLEDVSFVQNLLGKSLELGFKESNVILALSLKGVQNTFCAEILEITRDSLFARVFLKDLVGTITALCPLEFIEKNSLKVGDSVDWHIPESEAMVFLKAEE